MAPDAINSAMMERQNFVNQGFAITVWEERMGNANRRNVIKGIGVYFVRLSVIAKVGLVSLKMGRAWKGMGV